MEASGLSNAERAYLKINYYDSNFVQFAPSTDSNKLTDTTTDWTRLEAHVNPNAAPAGTAYIKPVVTAYNFTGTAYYDSIRFQEGNITSSYEYNAADANGKGANNYVTKATDPLGNSASSTYDIGTGNKMSSTDAKGNMTSYTYDNFDRLKTVAIPGYDLKTVYTYDANGNRTQVKNTNKAGTVTYNTTNYQYNQLDLLTSVTDPLNRITTFRYDAGGNNTSTENANGSKIGNVYNKANRLEQVTYNDVAKYTFGYDANGNRTSVQDNSTNKTWNYTFDKVNRLTKVIAPDGSSQESTFDKNSNRLTQQITVGASSYTNTYVNSITDQNIELTDVNQNKSKFGYDENGNLIQMILGNGAVMNSQFDGDDRVTKVVNTKASGDILSSFSYSLYDANGNREQVTDHTGKTIAYSYDSLDQLLSETDPLSSNTIWYTYDERGNRTKKEIKDTNGNVLSTITYTYDAANQLTGVNGQTYTYDANGNLIDDGSKTYTWDADDRLTEVRNKADNSLIAQYEYDAAGRRVKSTVGGIVTNFHYDGESIRVLYETDGSGNLTNLYTYSNNGQLLSMTKVGQGTYYYHYNGHGDVVQLTDQSGTVVAEYTYDAWGNIVSSSGTMANNNPYRYAGYRYDSETELYYLIARYYNSKNGNFLSLDPEPGDSDDPITLNGYTYATNNPVMLIDPDGNWVVDAFWLMLDAAEFMGHPSLAGAGWIAADLAAFADPSGIASTVAHAGKMARMGKWLSKAVKLSKRAKRAKKARSFSNCFAAGTKVQTDKGEKPIEDIKVGDKVLAKDDETGEMAYKEVEWLFQREVDETYNIAVGGEVITTTDEHPFWIVGKGWVESKNLVVGDVLTTSDGKELAIEKIEVKKEHKTVYNFKVKDFHTYFVSNLRIWTHNSCKFTPNKSGYYGTPGQGGSHTRNLTGGNTAAKNFFDEKSVGATNIEQKGKVTIAHMPGGQRIVYRRTSSSDGTPVVEIHGKGAIKEQKIHFID